MKKTLSILALLGFVACAVPSANAFSWSNLNPANWGHCNKCEKKCNPCDTGYAAPCDPCEKKKVKKCDPCKVKQPVQQPCEPCQKVRENCDPCDQLQNMNK